MDGDQRGERTAEKSLTVLFVESRIFTPHSNPIDILCSTTMFLAPGAKMADELQV
jgi:hypothetical protein